LKVYRRLVAAAIRKTARVARDGEEIDVPIKRVMLDGIVLLRPSDEASVDGLFLHLIQACARIFLGSFATLMMIPEQKRRIR
jgi:hypothetical protein